MDNEAQILLDDIISFCQRDGLDTRLINMLGQSIPVSLDDESLTLQVPSRFASTYLLKQQDGTQGRGPRDARAGTSTAAGAPGIRPSSIFTSGSTRSPRGERIFKIS